MKKMYNYRRRGFTLVEIIVVVAIIVVLSGAAFVGVAVTVERAKNKGDAVSDHAADFEDDAWNQVREIAVGAADFFEIYEYTPETPTPTPEDEDEEEEEEETPTTSPTPTPKPDTTATPTPKPTNTPTPKPANGANPHIAATYTSTNGTNAQGSSVSGTPKITHDYTETWYWTQERGSWSEKTYTNTRIETSGSITASSKIEQAIITVPAGTTSVTIDNWKYSIEKIDDTHYKIWYSAAEKQGEGHYEWSPPETSVSYRVSEYYSDPNVNKSAGVVVSEYSTSK